MIRSRTSQKEEVTQRGHIPPVPMSKNSTKGANQLLDTNMMMLKHSSTIKPHSIKSFTSDKTLNPELIKAFKRSKEMKPTLAKLKNIMMPEPEMDLEHYQFSDIPEERAIQRWKWAYKKVKNR